MLNLNSFKQNSITFSGQKCSTFIKAKPLI